MTTNGNNRSNASTRGSLHTVANGRINTHQAKQLSNKFDSRDARQKLLRQDQTKTRDARDILKQKFNRVESARVPRDANRNRADRNGNSNGRSTVGSSGRGSSFSTRSRDEDRKRSRDRRPESRKEPIVIVTGLGRDRKPNGKDHYVVSRGKNTLVTLNNDKYSGNSNQRDQRDQRRNSRDRQDKQTASSSSNSRFEPIKIKITNSNYNPNHMDEDISSMNDEDDDQFINQQSNNSTKHFNHSKSEDSMDCADISDYESSTRYPVDKPPPPIKYNTNNPPPSAAFTNLYNRMLPSSTYQPSQPPPSTNNASFNSFNTAMSALKPTGLIVNNFPTAGMYSQSGMYDSMWNTSSTNFLPLKTPPANLNVVATKQYGGQVMAKDGYKLLVSNLHPKVTEDDVLELFSDIGPIKRARFIDKGLAEVVYVRIEHAKEAIQKYDLKELDGRQMVIGFADKSHLTTVAAPQIEASKPRPPLQLASKVIGNNQGRLQPVQPQLHQPSQTINTSHFSGSFNANLFNHAESLTINAGNGNKYSGNNSYYNGSRQQTSNTLSHRFKSKTDGRMQIPQSKHSDKLQTIRHLDNSIVHQVLFNKKPLGGSPVTFTVKL